MEPAAATRIDEASSTTEPEQRQTGPWRPARPTLEYAVCRWPRRYEVVRHPAREQAADGRWRWSRETAGRAATGSDLTGSRRATASAVVSRSLRSECAMRRPETCWPHDEVGHNGRRKARSVACSQTSRRSRRPSPSVSCSGSSTSPPNPGDVVLDCFAGSGTTAAVAQKMGRRWIAVESVARHVSDVHAAAAREGGRGRRPGRDHEGQGLGGRRRVPRARGRAVDVRRGRRARVARRVGGRTGRSGRRPRRSSASATSRSRRSRAGRDARGSRSWTGSSTADVARLLVGALAPEEKLVRLRHGDRP